MAHDSHSLHNGEGSYERQADGGRPTDTDMMTLAELKRAGIVDGGRNECRFCKQSGDCRPAALQNWRGVPALCDACYRWVRNRGLFDEARDTALFYPPELGGVEMIATDGGEIQTKISAGDDDANGKETPTPEDLPILTHMEVLGVDIAVPQQAHHEVMQGGSVRKGRLDIRVEAWQGETGKKAVERGISRWARRNLFDGVQPE